MLFQFIHLSLFQKHDVVKGNGADAQHKALVETTKHTLAHEPNRILHFSEHGLKSMMFLVTRPIKAMSRLYIPSALYRNEITSNSSKRFLD